MGKIAACSLIIKDDFNNVLIIQRKAKRNAPKVWEILQGDVKGKQTPEKTISKMAQRELKTIIFELTPFKEYVIDEEKDQVLMSYTGKLKERITLHKEIVMQNWISKDKLDEYEFAPGHKEKLLDYFK